MANFYIGTSGWRYASWRNDFYPTGLRQKDELLHIAKQLTSLEVNGSFYSLQRPSSFEKWYDETPENFRLAVKGSRYITHMLKLKNVNPGLNNFFASGLLTLGQKLGPILWQLPESLTYDEDRVDHFLNQLPISFAEASALGAGFDAKLKYPPHLDYAENLPIHYALEIRHESYKNQRFYEQLREHNIALVMADTAGRWPLMAEKTADFSYTRLHGSEILYSGDYSHSDLESWAEKVRSITGQAGDAYVYFDNDIMGRAPYNSLDLLSILSPSSGV
jgi:uncharacterized protein YecE (DUF72 family)